MAHAGLQGDGGHRQPLSAAETLYGQPATQLTLKLFLDDHPVDGRVIVDLAQTFLKDLMLPDVAPSLLWTRRPGLQAKLNVGPFSERRWAAAVPKLIAGEYGVLYIQATDPRRAHRTAQLSIVVNPTCAADAPVDAEIELSCSIPYARELCRAPQRIEALLRMGVSAWTSTVGAGLYGYANVASIPPRPMFGQPGWRPPGFDVLASLAPPTARPHPIPVAYLGDIDLNLAALYRAGRGIKGAFWANFLASRHVQALGGEATCVRACPASASNPWTAAACSSLPRRPRCRTTPRTIACASRC